jgi:hypothetical protein
MTSSPMAPGHFAWAALRPLAAVRLGHATWTTGASGDDVIAAAHLRSPRAEP